MFSRPHSLWRALRNRSQQEHDLDDEMRHHLENRTGDLIRSGLTHEDALRRAHIEFGCLEAYQDLCRESRRVNWAEDLVQDVRFALRMLRKSPGFAIIAILTLALGIGANTAIFSVVNVVVLRPLPFKDSERVVMVSWAVSSRDLPNGTTTLEVAADFEQGNLNLAGSGPAERILAAEVSESFFRVFALSPVRGRTLEAQDEKPGLAPVVLLSNELWRTRYNSDPNILAKTIFLNGKAFTPIGVLPGQFDFPAESQVWLPLPPKIEQDVFGGNAIYRAQIGRLRAGATLAEARSEMQVIQQREAGSQDLSPVIVQTLHRYLVGDTRKVALLLFGAVGFVLLIACADVANLLLSRGAGRAREVAVRRALGAGRSRLVRQFLSESILLALLGGIAGLLGGWWAIVAVRALIPAQNAFATQISLNSSVLLFTCMIAMLTGILAGLVPALQATGPHIGEALKEAARSSPGGFRLGFHHGMRSLLGISEIALALILVIGAALFLRSFDRLMDVNPGFRTDNLLTARISLLGPKYETVSARARFMQQVLARTRSLPGVQTAAFGNDAPLGFGFGDSIMGLSINVEGSKTSNDAGALYMTASPDYFRALGIPLLAGRDFTEGDADGAKPVAILSGTLAKNRWADRNPIGGRFTLEGSKQEIEVVGVVGDIRLLGLDNDILPTMYFPVAQESPAEATLLVHANRDPLSLAAPIRDVIRDVDADEPVASFHTMDQLLAQSVAQPRFRTLLLGIFGALALTLALVGVYGVISYTVAQRTHEIGIRVALGAQRRDVLRIIVGYGLRVAAVGVCFGLIGAFLLARFTSTFLFSIQPTDPLTFVLGSAGLIVVVLAASYIPARRAMRVDPMVALRHE